MQHQGKILWAESGAIANRHGAVLRDRKLQWRTATSSQARKTQSKMIRKSQWQNAVAIQGRTA
jgi:hypothetical protein